jgi:hypothetical protein
VTWLIWLYPPAWRRRYGRELAELLATQPVSFRSAIDLVAGAVDAWLNPQSSTSTAAMAADQEGEGAMVAKMLKLRYTGNGSEYTGADALKAAAVTISGTLAMVLALTWGMARYGRNDYLVAFLAVSWVVPLLFSKRYTDLKGRSARVQAVLIAGPAAIVIAIVLAAVWLNNN